MQRLQALGRLKAGAMNKTEAAYCRLLEQRRHIGEILWFRFEGIKLRLADNTFLTVDFSIMRADKVIEMVDVKGSKAIFADDARAKMKIAADQYPFIFKAVYPKAKRDGGGWDVEEF
ncbi:DUF1064 domain-containing protein [Allopusillimonas ginsengisoli]|nr:DUF1064 domain-containing protein [Allopusillimonas ginsengisoli]